MYNYTTFRRITLKFELWNLQPCQTEMVLYHRGRFSIPWFPLLLLLFCKLFATEQVNMQMVNYLAAGAAGIDNRFIPVKPLVGRDSPDR